MEEAVIQITVGKYQLILQGKMVVEIIFKLRWKDTVGGDLQLWHCTQRSVFFGV